MWYMVFAFSLYVCVYTFSYGIFEWKNSNKSGAIAVWILCVAALAVPLVKIFY